MHSECWIREAMTDKSYFVTIDTGTSVTIAKSDVVAAARCDRVREVRLEPPLETVDSVAGMGSKAAHEAEVRTPVEAPWKEPKMMTRVKVKVKVKSHHDRRPVG
jgi:hypothetical protein